MSASPATSIDTNNDSNSATMDELTASALAREVDEMTSKKQKNSTTTDEEESVTSEDEGVSTSSNRFNTQMQKIM